MSITFKNSKHKRNMRRSIELPISVVLFAIIGLMVFSILLGFIPKVLGSLLGGFMSSVSATKAQSIEEARAICQQWCSLAKTSSTPEKFLNSDFCTKYVAIPSQTRNACGVKNTKPNLYVCNGIYKYDSGNSQWVLLTGCEKYETGSQYNLSSDANCKITNFNVDCRRNGFVLKCNVELKTEGSCTVDSVKLFYGIANGFVVALAGEDESSVTIKNGGSYTISQSKSLSLNSGSYKGEIEIEDPCYTKYHYDKARCESDSACSWLKTGKSIELKKCYENPIGVVCSLPPLLVGTVQYSCASDEKGCFCIGSDGSILRK